MTVAALGKVTIGGVQLTTDPQDYAPLTWEKRVTVLPGMGKASTVQDFGMTVKDNIIEMASGPTGFMEQSVVETLHGMYRTRGATYAMIDWCGNEFVVFILAFLPKPTFIGSLWTYTMRLKVMSCSKLFGTSYTGD